MKIMTVLGTRPEIIRLSLVIKRLDEIAQHVVVHTGQNYAESLNDIFFRDLGVRPPDHSLGIRTDWMGEQVGRIIADTEKLIVREKPDRLLILGDTNSGLAAIPAKRHAVPVYHMEAGNRCYDDRVPEEINRRIIDHCSDVLMPYTQRSKENLVREGIERERIFVTGNPIFEVLEHFRPQIDASDVFRRLNITKGQFFLVTMHRAENVDVESRLRDLVAALQGLAAAYRQPIICSLHPRTKAKMEQFGIRGDDPLIRWMEPLGFFDFVALERSARCVLSDSGTVQEECAIFGVPNLTIRDVTERPETIECGSNVLSGSDPKSILGLVAMLLASSPSWSAPPEYLQRNVSMTVAKLLMGYRHGIHSNG